MRLQFLQAFLLVCTPSVSLLAAQPEGRLLKQRDIPCQAQYAQAVETIGLARWSAPEPERTSIERLLNAAAKAKELIDASFLQYDAALCSGETLGRLHSSVDRLHSNGWLPSTPEERRDAQAAAVNAELLKAMSAGADRSSSADNTGIRRSISE